MLQHHDAVPPHYVGTLFLDPAPAASFELGLQALDEPEANLNVRKVGEPGSLDYRVYLQEGEADVSAWHGLPLSNGNGTFNFVCEIPQDTTAKMEVATVCSALARPSDIGFPSFGTLIVTSTWYLCICCTPLQYSLQRTKGHNGARGLTAPKSFKHHVGL